MKSKDPTFIRTTKTPLTARAPFMSSNYSFNTDIRTMRLLIPQVFLITLMALYAIDLAAHTGSHTGGDGEKPAATPRVEITIEGNIRKITGNGIADHSTGQFPNRRNPHSIRTQRVSYQVPAEPILAEGLTPLGRQPFGVALNGVVFDPGTAESWNMERNSKWRYEAIKGALDLGEDVHHAHVQPTGTYHYHGLPTGLLQELNGGRPEMTLIGWAADGFPIYGPYGYTGEIGTDGEPITKLMLPSYVLKEGQRPGSLEPKEKRNHRRPSPESVEPGGTYDGTFTADFEYIQGAGDLDQANGKFGPTPEFPEGIYHYYVTEDFPFIPRFFRGKPDSSFERHHGGRDRPSGRPPVQPRRTFP
ncbi:MAG: YHYH protein [Verrucomicrobiota bacterium]